MAMATDAHTEGARRLDSALLDQDRLRKRFQSAVGTATEFGAYIRLENAREVVSARREWLSKVDAAIASDIGEGGGRS
jgi:excinuclease UvrABC ATPase subunit